MTPRLNPSVRRRSVRILRILVPLLVGAIGLGASPASAQLGRLGDAARRAAEAAKKAEDSKRERDAEEAKKKEEAPPVTAPAPPTAAEPPAAAPTPATPATQDAAASAPTFAAYSKFDFVPGEKVVAVDDFTQDAIGDFPDKWNTNGSAEIVTLAGKPGRWLKLTKGGFFTPEFITELPDNFTLEFDLTVPPTFEGPALVIAIVELENRTVPAAWSTSPNGFIFTTLPGPSEGSSDMSTRQDGDTVAGNQARTSQLAAKSANPVHVSLWRQRQRVRVYINQEKVWDLPRALAAPAKLNSVFFSLPEVDVNNEYYLSNVRVATGAPDTRNKILTEGKWVSHGILFDVNSDRIKGESYGSLKEIAGVLTENKDLKVQIVGHTDGDEAANLDLSKRRAASVKATLTREFGIDAGRMDTDGKGESQPVDKNDNPSGKANNRRVEFIKK
jgi:outer membrane protein OmpA-like peptidoglycan-associated protein